jgi:hypothetical protein
MKTYNHKLKYDVNWQMQRWDLTKEQAEEKIKKIKKIVVLEDHFL